MNCFFFYSFCFHFLYIFIYIDDTIEKDFSKAIELYTKAIEVETDAKKLAVLYANRAFSHLKQESFGYALNDAQTAIKSDPTYLKGDFFYVIFVSQNVRNIKILGYYRRAASLVALGKFKQALSDYELVCKRCPSDEDAKTKFTECNKMVKKIAFEKAIAVDKVDKTLAEVFKDLESIAIEDDYVGPKLENGNVTVKFMEELLDWYKNQKKLHRKYAYKVSFSCNNQYKKITTKILDFM